MRTLALENLGPRPQSPIEIHAQADQIISYQYVLNASTIARISARRIRPIMGMSGSCSPFLLFPSMVASFHFTHRRKDVSFYVLVLRSMKNWSPQQCRDYGRMKPHDDEKACAKIFEGWKAEEANRLSRRQRSAGIFQGARGETSSPVSSSHEPRTPRAHAVGA